MITKLNFILTLCFFLLSACSIEQAPPEPGPEGSWWLGGDDGGVFIKIEDDATPGDNIYNGVIFFEHDKTVWYRGPFKLVGELPFVIKNKDLYLFWDGERVHLEQSSYLEAVNPVPPL